MRDYYKDKLFKLLIMSIIAIGIFIISCLFYFLFTIETINISISIGE